MRSTAFPSLRHLLASVESDEGRQFWGLQFLGWGGMCVVALLSLGLWYESADWQHASYVLLLSASGLLLSLPLHLVFRFAWSRPTGVRLLLGFGAVAIAALLWSAIEVWALALLPGRSHLPDDAAVWYLASFTMLFGWSAMYHGVRYYQLLQQEIRRSVASASAVREETLQRLQAQAVAREAQLKMLRYQLNPHFLFNTLNAIGALVRFGDADKAHRMIVQLSQFLRYSLDINPGNLITLGQELDAVMLYLAIEKTRFEDRLRLEVDVDQDAARGRVPSLLLQPLVENAVKYAIAPSEQGGSILLAARVSGSELIIEVSDSGSGVVPGPATTRRGGTGRPIGLNNVLERLKTLYQDAYDFVIEMLEPSGLKVTIRIPYDPDASAPPPASIRS